MLGRDFEIRDFAEKILPGGHCPPYLILEKKIESPKAMELFKKGSRKKCKGQKGKSTEKGVLTEDGTQPETQRSRADRARESRNEQQTDKT